MMKKLLFFLFAFCLFNTCFSQTLSPEIISTAGSSFNNGTNELSWTLGEPATFTLSNSELLTQGFHQGNLVITGLDGAEMNNEIIIFPNPTIETIQLQFKTPYRESTIELYTVDGKLILARTLYAETFAQIDMSDKTSGTYILKVKNKNSRTYQIIKLR